MQIKTDSSYDNPEWWRISKGELQRLNQYKFLQLESGARSDGYILRTYEGCETLLYRHRMGSHPTPQSSHYLMAPFFSYGEPEDRFHLFDAFLVLHRMLIYNLAVEKHQAHRQLVFLLLVLLVSSQPIGRHRMLWQKERLYMQETL